MRRMAQAAVLVALVAVAAGCTNVPPGYVGIKVNSWGAQRGVNDFPLQVGRVGFNPLTTDVYQFPTFMQRENWSGEQGFTCRSKQGQAVGLDIAVAYTFQADKVPSIFVKFRQEPEAITAGYIHDTVRGTLCGRTEHFDIMEILGEKLSQVTNEVTALLNQQNKDIGIHFEYVNVVGKPHVDQSVEAAINNVIKAVQDASAAEARVRQAQFEADSAIKQAEGVKQSEIVKAQGAAEANRIINESLNDRLIQYRLAGKWDGHLPTVTGSGTPLLQLPVQK